MPVPAKNSPLPRMLELEVEPVCILIRKTNLCTHLSKRPLPRPKCAFCLTHVCLPNRNNDRLAWFVFDKIVCRTWFETIVLICILLIGVATGVDLESDGGEGSPGIALFLYLVTEVTKVIFAMECFLKIIAEGYHPDR